MYMLYATTQEEGHWSEEESDDFVFVKQISKNDLGRKPKVQDLLLHNLTNKALLSKRPNTISRSVVKVKINPLCRTTPAESQSRASLWLKL